MVWETLWTDLSWQPRIFWQSVCPISLHRLQVPTSYIFNFNKSIYISVQEHQLFLFETCLVLNYIYYITRIELILRFVWGIRQTTQALNNIFTPCVSFLSLVWNLDIKPTLYNIVTQFWYNSFCQFLAFDRLLNLSGHIDFAWTQLFFFNIYLKHFDCWMMLNCNNYETGICVCLCI